MAMLCNILHKTAIDPNKSIPKSFILFTIPFLIYQNILFCFWAELNHKRKPPLNTLYTSSF